MFFLLLSKGTHHLWSVPVLPYQDITYHFRVSLSVSNLVLVDALLRSVICSWLFC